MSSFLPCISILLCWEVFVQCVDPWEEIGCTEEKHSPQTYCAFDSVEAETLLSLEVCDVEEGVMTWEPYESDEEVEIGQWYYTPSVDLPCNLGDIGWGLPISIDWIFNGQPVINFWCPYAFSMYNDYMECDQVYLQICEE